MSKIEEEFIDLCEDFGGEVKEESHMLSCILDIDSGDFAYDGFLSISHWLKSQIESKNLNLKNELMVEFIYSDGNEDFMQTTYVDFKGNIYLEVRKNEIITSNDSLWESIEEEYGEDIIFDDKTFYKEMSKAIDRLENNIKKRYGMINVECSLDEEYDTYLADCEVNMPINNLDFQKSIELAEKIVNEGVNRLTDDFYALLQESILKEEEFEED